MNQKVSLFFRYIILLIVGLPGPYLFYLVFTPLTIYPVFFVLRLFYPSIILENTSLIIGANTINLIPACIAGAAYYLILILNLAMPMKLEKRARSIIFAFFSFLLLNILRIVIFTALFIGGFELFDLAHKLTWYLGSTILIVAIWFLSVYIYKIKEIPFYTDLKNLSNTIINKGKRKK